MAKVRALACGIALSAVGLVVSAGSTGGSKACSHTGFYSKKVVPMCEKHFPDEGAKNAWVVQYYHAHIKDGKEVKEAYEKFADSKKLQGSKVGAIDCQHNGEFCAKHGIRTVPTTRVMFGGNTREFEGAHTSFEALEDFVPDSLKRFKEMEEALQCKVKSIFNDPKKDSTLPLCTDGHFPPSTEVVPWLITFYESGDRNKDKTMKSVMNKLADKYGNVPPKKLDAKKKTTKMRVGAVDCSEQKGCEELGITTFPAVRFYRKNADPSVFDSFFDREEIQKWADAEHKMIPKEVPVAVLKVDVPEGEAKTEEKSSDDKKSEL